MTAFSGPFDVVFVTTFWSLLGPCKLNCECVWNEVEQVVEIEAVPRVASGKRVCASALHALATTRRAIGGAVNSVIVVDDFEGVSLGRSGSKGEDEVGGAGGLGSGERGPIEGDVKHRMDGVVSSVASLRDLRLSTGIAAADWRDKYGDAEDWARENKSNDIVLGEEDWGDGGGRRERSDESNFK
ncbi:uncharacterized protein FOMMEDRAFT_154325 [Fomitiporia mediterranea MF3/22]|uniref:uncharacterized protein n=1 Tax=Fomitiporia mediterranea (strain MF3/22) TaxID=694068 RepID=UPI000440989D|nr:uncharacterized protein FOMMEDRAFT_154325 [Fomitiporia mediterranea MF3/22]EJD05136.1 hypothetical protein FOMMEDRAFT_154325 [Fomitiporia mediterranea MF3/22]